MIAQFALATILSTLQDKPDQSGLPQLKSIMQMLQAGNSGHISGSRYTENSPTQLEYEGDFQIFRKSKTHLRYQFGNFWGDTSTLLIITPKTLVETDIDGRSTTLDSPKSWAIRSEAQRAEEFGGLIVSFLAPEKDLGLFIDLSKPITLNPTSQEIEFTHVSGSKHTIKLLPNKTVAIRTPNPGFPGFREPSNQLDIFHVRDSNPKLPNWYFETKPHPER